MAPGRSRSAPLPAGTSDQTPTNRVGRPRSTPQVSDIAPVEEILDAAARLFSTTGYSTTTTREIADAVGLRQGSLFHYFKRKEDMLAELLDRTVEPARLLLERVEGRSEAADVKLFTLVRRDVENLCSGSYNLGKLQLLPEVRVERFEGFWEKRMALRNGYRSLIQQATNDGYIAVGDIELGTDMLFGFVESVITWFERGTERTPSEVGLALATSGLRALGAKDRRLPALKSGSDKILSALH